ncbi:MAG: S-layer homology domain-containing protein [Clostridia bacterium]|nr:S-layer homology domain-containing protein [Clostridia bacterium]
MKKICLFSAVLAASMLFSIAVFADFSDMPEESWAVTAINNAVEHGILSGYEDGTVRPASNITRAEMASIISRACGATGMESISFIADVKKDSWYYEPVAKAVTMGAFHGDENGFMYPENNISFQETFTVLSQVFDLLPPYTKLSEDPYEIPANKVYTQLNHRLYDVSVLAKRSDAATTADWAKIYVAGVITHGGGEGVVVRPTEYITRAEFAIVMDHIIQNYIDEPGTYDSLPEGNTIIRCDGVMLNELTTNGDIYIADSVSQGGIVVNNITANRLIVRGCATPLDSKRKMINDNFGISITGTFDAIRVIRPNIVADLMYAKYKKLWAAAGTSVNLGEIKDE